MGLNFVKSISTRIEGAERLLKFLRFGSQDIQENSQVAPPGIDSAPIKDMIALYGDTAEKGEKVIIGYINKNQVAQPGEFRIFSINNAGIVQTFIWLKADGTILMGGDAKNMVRFQELEEGFNQLRDDFNGHSHAGNGVPPTVPSVADISGAKIDEIKTL